MKYYVVRFLHLLLNRFLLKLPLNCLRVASLKSFGAAIGHGSKLGIGVKVISPRNLSLGSNVIINSSVFLDCRGGVLIEDNVDIAWRSAIITAYHDYDDPQYKVHLKSVKIETYSCLAYMSTILPGVTIRRGTVVASCSIVTASHEDSMSILAGSPAKKIRSRASLGTDPYILRRTSYGW